MTKSRNDGWGGTRIEEASRRAKVTEERTDKYLDIFLRPMQHSSLSGRLDSGGKEEEEEEEEGEQRDEGEEEEEAEAAAALMEAKTITLRRKGRGRESEQKRKRDKEKEAGRY